jgi:ATP-dependent Zn protease
MLKNGHAYRRLLRGLPIIVMLLLAVDLVFPLFRDRVPRTVTQYPEFLEQVYSGRVSAVTIQGCCVTYTLTDGRTLLTHTTRSSGLPELLADKHVTFSVVPPDDSKFSWRRIEPALLGPLFSIYFTLYLVRRNARAKGSEVG